MGLGRGSLPLVGAPESYAELPSVAKASAHLLLEHSLLTRLQVKLRCTFRKSARLSASLGDLVPGLLFPVVSTRSKFWILLLQRHTVFGFSEQQQLHTVRRRESRDPEVRLLQCVTPPGRSGGPGRITPGCPAVPTAPPPSFPKGCCMLPRYCLTKSAVRLQGHLSELAAPGAVVPAPSLPQVGWGPLHTAGAQSTGHAVTTTGREKFVSTLCVLVKYT